MRFLIVGSGMQGRACAYDLVRGPGVKSVVLADSSRERLDSTRRWLSSPLVETEGLDASDQSEVARLASRCDVVVSCAPYFLNLGLAKAALSAKRHFIDLGGNTDIVRQELALDEEARRAGVTLIPDNGLGPGMINTIAVQAMSGYESVDEVLIRDGGLPQEPAPPLNYALFFSVHGLINEYVDRATVLRDYRREQVEGLSEVETIDLPPPLGRCEAAHAAGGLSTMAWTFEGKVRRMDNKLIRYPGHIGIINAMKAVGFFADGPVDAGGVRVAPRALSARLLERHLDRPGTRDLVVIQVTVRGMKEGRRQETVCEMLDLYDESTGLTAMMRTTGFPASIVAQMLASGAIRRPGAYPVELGVPAGPFLAEAEKRGFKFRWRSGPA